MKKSSLAILFAATLAATACSTWNNAPYYSDQDTPPPPPSNNYNNGRAGYTVDNRYVYFRGVKISGADVVSFRDLGDGYAKDSRYVYYNGQRLKGENPNTFTGRSSDRRAGQRSTPPTTTNPPRNRW